MIQQTRDVSYIRLIRTVAGRPYVPALLLLVVAVAINYALQPNFFVPSVLSGNLRTYLPLLLVAAGQTVVILGGGIDLSLGTIVPLANVVMVLAMGENASLTQVLLAIALGLLAGITAGALNGLCIAYLRFQPIVTTFATSFVFGGVALWIMPSPGGSVPAGLMDVYRLDPLGVPIFLWVALALLVLWGAFRATRYGVYLFAVGGEQNSAFVSGVPVSAVRIASYCIGGGLAALAGLAFAMDTGQGDPLTGGEMLMLNSIVAAVIGGTSLRGGRGGIVGSLIGVLLLGLIQSIVSFSNVPGSWQTLVNALIIIAALGVPGLIALVRRRR